MATRKKAPKRSKIARERKTASKSNSEKSATTKTRSKALQKAKTQTKSVERKSASKPAAEGKKSVKKRKTNDNAPRTTTKVAKAKSPGIAKKRRGQAGRTASRNSATAPPPEEQPLPKTRLNDKQLAEFKQKLLEKRRMLTGDVRNLTLDALRRDGSGELSNMPIHMADIGSDNWEQEFTLGLIENEQQLVREIDDALARIVDRTYGVCIATGRHIGIARLRAKPWAKYCIEYAKQKEIGRR